jgi:TRAP-type C4-dicarboxylate transport system permease small subunit
MIATLRNIMTRTTALLALLGSVGIIAMLVHICAYVIGRHVAASPIPATVEIVSNYYMVLIAFLPLAWAERNGDMISVEVFGQFFKGAVKRANAILVAIVTAGAYAILTFATWFVAMREFGAKSFVMSLSVPIPVWPSYFILPISFGLATIICLLRVALIIADDDADDIAKHTPVEVYSE